jgi:hypothetical protein
MSYTEYKTVIRTKIDGLKNKSKNEVYEFFKSVIGEAKEVDEYDGKIDYFHYDDDAGMLCPVQNYRTKQWGVDYVLAHGSDYNGSPSDVNLSLRDIKKHCNMLTTRFGVKESNCKLVSYSWYNGGDEPIHF